MEERDPELAEDDGIVAEPNRVISQILKRDFGAIGSGIITKARSIEDKLPPSVFRSIGKVGRIRNAVVHDGITIAKQKHSRGFFNGKCRSIVEDLNWLSQKEIGQVDEKQDSTQKAHSAEFQNSREITPDELLKVGAISEDCKRPIIQSNHRDYERIARVQVPDIEFNPDKIDVDEVMRFFRELEEALPLESSVLSGLGLIEYGSGEDEQWLEYPFSFMMNLMRLLSSAHYIIDQLREALTSAIAQD